jgi:hypothetical protein
MNYNGGLFNRKNGAMYLGGILCGVLALGAAHGQILARPGAAGSSPTASKRTCQALRDFATKPFEEATPTPEKPLPECGSIEHYKFLLAMVPDPINTHLALFFDRVVESIENAVGDVGWEFARYSFPWDPLLAKEEADPEKRQKQKDARSEQEREPGVLLFRNRNDLTQHLAILLIAETPTAGLDRVQFETAWKYMGLDKKCATVQLIGPTFSGSFDSIRELGDCRRLIAFSGSATSAPGLREFENNGGLLHTFIHSDEWCEFQLTNHIRREWGNEGPIAILAEGETAFGTSFRAYRGKQRNDVDVFRFPREISHLRNAYAPVPDLSGASKQPVQSGQSVPLDLRDIGTGHDSIPGLSAQMALSQEAVLFSIGSQLRQKRYSFVGVLASNILDAVFLSRYLRTICPDSRVFVFDQDLLFTRASAESPLYGTISVATYSVLIANQRNSATPGARLQFPNQAAEGIYNATTAALVNARLADAKNAGVKLLDYNFPGRSTDEGKNVRPPLWITVLGRNAYWPVAVVNSPPEQMGKDTARLAESSATAGITKATAISLVPEAPGTMWSFVFVGASLALMAFAVAVWLGQFDAGARSPRWPASHFLHNEGSDNPLRRI